MPDYRELYFTLYKKVASATQLLLQAQLEAEERYGDDPLPPISLEQNDGDV